MTTDEGSLMDIEDSATVDSDASKLIISIMQQNAKDAAFTTNALMHGYRESQLRAEATIAAIRWNIMHLFKDGYQPTETAIIHAAWPSFEQIEQFMDGDIND